MSLFWLLTVAWLTGRHLHYRETHYIVGNDSRFAVSFTGESSLPEIVSCCYNLGEGLLHFVTFMNFLSICFLCLINPPPQSQEILFKFRGNSCTTTALIACRYGHNCHMEHWYSVLYVVASNYALQKDLLKS